MWVLLNASPFLRTKWGFFCATTKKQRFYNFQDSAAHSTCVFPACYILLVNVVHSMYRQSMKILQHQLTIVSKRERMLLRANPRAASKRPSDHPFLWSFKLCTASLKSTFAELFLAIIFVKFRRYAKISLEVIVSFW